jgi:hypothetical protein
LLISYIASRHVRLFIINGIAGLGSAYFVANRSKMSRLL